MQFSLGQGQQQSARCRLFLIRIMSAIFFLVSNPEIMMNCSKTSLKRHFFPLVNPFYSTQRRYNIRPLGWIVC